MRNKKRTRTCAGCGIKCDKGELLRISRLSDGTVTLNSTEGRGAYLCKDEKCLKTAIAKKRISRILRCNVSSEILEEIGKVLTEE